jgi:hypothetical protein
MRNYQKCVIGEVDWNDGSSFFSAFFMEPTESDLELEFQLFIDQEQPIFPGFSFTATNLGERWLELNKQKIQEFFGVLYANDPFIIDTMSVTASPRDFWDSSDPSFVDLGTQSSSGFDSHKLLRKQTQRTSVPTVVLKDIRVELAVAYTIARQQRNFAFASKILNIINQLDSGRITKAQAIKLWTALLAHA